MTSHARSAVVLPLMHPAGKWPQMGVIVRVFLKTGTECEASSKWTTKSGTSEREWYDTKTRRTIDCDMVKGWMPAIFRNEGLIAMKEKFGVGSEELRRVARPVFEMMEAYGMEKFTIDRTTKKANITIDGLTIE